jgi:hypothetical protein
MRLLAMVAVSWALFACGGCGGATKMLLSPTTSATNGHATATVSNQTPVSKQEIVKAKGCLKRERVRPARHVPNRPRLPGSSGVTRNGLPVTPQEYEATVRRCLTMTSSASAKAARKK